MKKEPIVITIIILISLFIPSMFFTSCIKQYTKINDIGSSACIISNMLNFYESNTDNTATMTFTELNTTTSIGFKIKDYNKIKISSTLAEGQIRVKFTQGDLWKTEVLEEIVPSNSESLLIPLDRWDKDQYLTVWVIGDNAKEGSVHIELIK